MAFKDMLDQMLAAGKDLAGQGQGLAQQHLNLPPAGPDRQQALANLGKGALGGAALAALLGTKGGRRLTGTAATLGGIAALGKVAFDAYQTWQANQAQAQGGQPGAPVSELSGPEVGGGDLGEQAGEQRSELLLRAMIAAAKADGHIDETERANIAKAIGQLGLDADTRLMLDAELARPLDPIAVAAGADTPEVAAEVYLASLFVIDVDAPVEHVSLGTVPYATVDAPHVETGVASEKPRVVFYLDCQLSGRRNNEGLGTGKTGVGLKHVEDGKNEGSGLAGSRLGLDRYVPGLK